MQTYTICGLTHFRRWLYFPILFVTSLALSQAPAKPSPGDDSAISAKARSIHNSALVIDTHADTPQRFLDENFDIGSTDPNADASHTYAIWREIRERRLRRASRVSDEWVRALSPKI